jgi:hypothetical protein
MFVIGQVPERAVSARVKHSIKFRDRHLREFDCICQGTLSFRILPEACSGCGLSGRFVALRVKRRLTSVRGSQGNLCSRIAEDKMGEANSSSQKPVFFPVLPNALWEVRTITIFMSFPLVFIVVLCLR